MMVGGALLAGAAAPGATADRTAETARQRIEETLRQRAGQPAPAAPTPAPTPVAEESYLELVARIQAQTEALRGIRAPGPVKVNILTPDDVRALLERLLAAELDKPETRAQERVLKMLELIPADTPLQAIYQNLLEGQLGGLYNPEDKSLYVVDTFDTRGFIGGVILSHEICHALQDVAFDLKTFLQEEKNLDAQKAKQAVVEGDATVLMMEWAMQNATMTALLELTTMFSSQSASLGEVPPVLVQDMLFSYLAGMQFCQAIQQQRPQDWRTLIFKYPPLSTEQILHPAKYGGPTRDVPMDVPLGRLPADSAWKEQWRSPMGEWAIRLFLTPPDLFPAITALTIDPLVREPIATEGAAGWGGDTLAYLEGPRGEGQAIAWRTAWDTPVDAAEFTRALLRRLGRLNAMAGAEVPEDIAPGAPLVVTGAGGSQVYVLRARSEVFVVMATNADGMAAGRSMLLP
jgi:hypothetical protein